MPSARSVIIADSPVGAVTQLGALGIRFSLPCNRSDRAETGRRLPPGRRVQPRRSRVDRGAGLVCRPTWQAADPARLRGHRRRQHARLALCQRPGVFARTRGVHCRRHRLGPLYARHRVDRQDFRGQRLAVVSIGFAMAYSAGSVIGSTPIGFLMDLFGAEALPITVAGASWHC